MFNMFNFFKRHRETAKSTELLLNSSVDLLVRETERLTRENERLTRENERLTREAERAQKKFDEMMGI